jgi:uncharacterized protein YecE (DUF72 family)
LHQRIAVAPQLRIGCSGWNYKSWRGTFYPAKLPPSGWLVYYASIFDTVEANGTFYRLPEGSTFAAWRREAPAGFLMAVKASRFLTHMKKLRDAEEPLDRLLSRAAELGPRLGPLLYQLPPNFHLDLERLEGFLRLLPRTIPVGRRRLRHVMEFRHPSWYVDDTRRLLERFDVSMCLHDKAGSEVSDAFVGPCAYVRFHGTSGRYHGSYGDDALRRWAARLVEEWRAGRDVFAYFNNDPEAVATKDAVRLRALVNSYLPLRQPSRRFSSATPRPRPHAPS